ncbi:S41 family peptidase [Prolixibacteraceae bacterium JC049]|nr:S41 family peptidase [Prolixibacteraceae bacterium JC049]
MLFKDRPYLVPLLLAIAVAIGVLLGNNLKRNTINNQKLFQKGHSSKISTILALISSEYVDSVSVKELEEKAIPEVLKNLDPHTVYIPAKEMVEVTEEMSGNFGGIGVQFRMQDDTVMVVDVIAGGPSKGVGILAGDRIVEVNDTTIAGIKASTNDIMKKLRGPKGTKVKVSVARRGTKNLIDFEITRGTIPIYSVDVSYMINKEIGFIKVNRFSEQTDKEFNQAIKKLKGLGAQKLIIDLRGNTGGSLRAVRNMTDEFLGKDALILKTKGAKRLEAVMRATERGEWEKGAIVVLIDEFSASASEILAGALQDNDRGIIIGRRSFGKGLVQEQIPMVDGSALRLTVAKYYTPSGRCIQKHYDKGNSESYFKDLSERMRHGEFLSQDSIHLPDSLKYYTLKGRVVYGGGGIMPDHFIPADTTGNSNYLYQLTRKGLVYQYAFKYADSNRKELSNLKTPEEFIQHLKNEKVFEAFIKYAATKGVKKDRQGLKKSGKIIHAQLYAYIARDILGEEGFYSMIRAIDITLEKAIDIISKE